MSPALAQIADQSDISLWSWPTWVFVIAVAGLAWLFTVVLDRARTDAHHPATPAHVPHHVAALLAGARCHLRCGLAGTIVRKEHPEIGGNFVPVCPGHSDEGDRKGWWVA